MRKTTVLAVICTAALLALKTAASGAPAPDPGVTRATLPNGLRVIVVRDALAPVVTTEVNYLVGSNDSPEDFPGMAHAQEHMMFRGSAAVSASQLAAITAAMGGDFNADTQQTITQYLMTVPSEGLELALHIEAARMHDVLDAQQGWSEERGPIEQEVAADSSNPLRKVFITLNADLYAGTPYARDGVGTRASFDKTTGAMLQSFYHQWYAPNNAILVIAGDVDPNAALATVTKLFGPIPRRPVPERPAYSLAPMKADTITADSDLSFALAAVAYRMPGSDSPDYAAAQVLSGVLASQRANLYALVPQGKALFAGYFSTGQPGAGAGIAVAAIPAGADATATADAIKAIIAGYVAGGVPADLVASAQRQALAQAEAKLNSISGLAQVWSQSLAVEGRDDPDADIRAMQSVSIDDVNRVARQYLDNARAVVGILNPKPSGKPVSQQAFGAPESFTPKDVKPVTLPAWASQALAALTIPSSTVQPYEATLRNGLHLIVQTETVSRTVQLTGSVKINPFLQEPARKEGVASVLDDLFTYGTTTLDRLAFQKALDDIAASASAGSSFSLSVLAPNFDRGVALLADNELHPVFDDGIFTAKVLPKDAAAVAGRLQSPDYLLGRALSFALLPKGDPALREATLESVSGLKLADAQTFYRAAFRPDMTTIVIIGDVTAAQARASIEKWFGNWTASGPKPQTDLRSVPLNKSSSAVVPDTSRVQDNVTLKENLAIDRSNTDYYALQVGNHVLGGAFYATRLYHDLREKAGLVYFVGNQLAVGKTRSSYVVNYGCDPPNVSKAKALIVRDLRQMQTRAVTAAELAQAKALLLREIPLAESDEDAIAGGLMTRHQAGLPLDEPVRAAHIYVGITAEQVRAAFAKWIRPAAFVQAVQGPAPH